ncbi:MAG: hypothetical protein A2W23_06775 [Planctomycetes bacterium RBG_16_43_13]|nr:MAG: hypothetical protein A2W23_06775 [Planctomycetes bacterium RBG_16_43_13]
MKILHILFDWKFTGPAEPMLDLCVELKRAGCEVSLACKMPPPDANISLLQKAKGRGLKPICDFALNKRPNLLDNLADIKRLSKFLRENRIDIIHTHQTHDHLLGGIAAKLSGSKTKVVRTNYSAEPINSLLLNELTDAQIVFSKLAHSPYKTSLINPAMELERYNPEAHVEGAKRVRAKYGIGQDDFVLGVVARIQRHRRFDVLLKGIKLVSEKLPNLKVLIVGRGTHREEVAVEPAKRLGLDGTVIFTGYLKGDDYLDTVAAFDAIIFLVPGSDGTCRALREAMAMAKPAIGADRGMIPEIVDDGKTGIIIRDDPLGIVAGIIALATEHKFSKKMGLAAREKALRCYSIKEQAKRVVEIYAGLF